MRGSWLDDTVVVEPELQLLPQNGQVTLVSRTSFQDHLVTHQHLSIN